MIKEPEGIGRTTYPHCVEPELDFRLKVLQFDPGLPVYRATPDLEFDDFMNVIRSQLDTPNLCDPYTLTFKRRDHRLGPWPILLAIEVIQIIRKPYRMTPEELIPLNIGASVGSEWYFRGRVCWYKDPYNTIGQLHAYIPTDTLGTAHGWPDGVIIQIVKEPSGADADTPITWGVGVPDGSE